VPPFKLNMQDCMRKTGGDSSSIFRFIEHLDTHLPQGPIRVPSERAGGSYRNTHILLICRIFSYYVYVLYIMHVPYFLNILHIEAIFCIFYILFFLSYIIIFCPARIDDGDEADDWHVTDHRSGNDVPLRADHWYQHAPGGDPIASSGDFAGIRINIWNRVKDR
jgi:hypothetical protein